MRQPQNFLPTNRMIHEYSGRWGEDVFDAENKKPKVLCLRLFDI